MQAISANVLLLDDEAPSLELSRQVIASFVPEKFIFTAEGIPEAMDILRTERIDIAFLDVELKQSDGFTFCQYIHREYPSVTVVILTGHVDFGAMSYDYEPFDFLVKPLDILRLERTLTRYQKRIQEKTRGEASSRLVIENGNGFSLLDIDEILYFSKSGNSCQVHCDNGQIHRMAYTLDKLEGMLKDRGFFRTYQSDLVSVKRIRKVNATAFGTSYEAVLDDGSVVPVSRNKYAKLKEYILKQSMKL